MNAANKLLGGLLALIAKMPPEGLQIVSDLVNAIANSKDPVAAARLAALAAAAKQGRHLAIQKAIGR